MIQATSLLQERIAHLLSKLNEIRGDNSQNFFKKKECPYLVSLSTPCCLYCISMLICSSSRFRRATLLRASATSDLSRSGSYFVLLTLEVVEFTEIRNLYTKYNVEFCFDSVFLCPSSASLIWDQPVQILKAFSHQTKAEAKAKISFDVCRLLFALFCFHTCFRLVWIGP